MHLSYVITQREIYAPPLRTLLCPQNQSLCDEPKSTKRHTHIINDYERPVKNYYSTVDEYARFLDAHGHKAKRLSVIIIVLLVYPTNAAGVERIFSAVSWLKDKLSNRKSDRTLNASLHTKFNDCKIDDYSLL